MTATTHPSKLRSRLILLLIVAMFFGSFGIAAWLRFTGWMPEHTRNIGELLHPPITLADLALKQADGQAYVWRPDKNGWHVLVAPTPDCTATCMQVFDRLHRMWLSEGRQAARLDVLWFGPLSAGATPYRGLILMQPNPALIARLPEGARDQTMPMYLVDAEGFVALHYRAGTDAADVRKDLARLLK